MRLAVHNAVQLTDDEVRSRFVVRRHEFDELAAHLRDAEPPRHALVIGQRGMGKSLLLRRLAVAVADDGILAAHWLPVLMPEELYEVTSIGELWLAALDRLAILEEDPALAAQHAALLAEPDSSRLAPLALERLLTAARERGRKILLLVENIDMLLDEQVDLDDAWTLRQALQTEPDLLLVATAVTRFEQAEREGEAFYGFFHRIDLRPLDDGEVRTMWREITDVELNATRTAPIRIITGGNPRLVTVLAQFTKAPTVRSLRESLELLIDEYTPYFKANIEALPPKERKVFITLADIWAPATAAEIAERARMTSNGVSALLNRLVGRGAVQVVTTGQRRTHYEVCERFYNLYHLLRRPDGEGRVRALVDILSALYAPGELDRDVLPRLLPRTEGTPPSAIDASVAAELWRRLEASGIWKDMSPAELAERLPTIEAILETQRATLGEDHPETMVTRGQVALLAHRVGDPAKALHAYTDLSNWQAKLLGPEDPHTLTSRHLMAYHLAELGDKEGALALFREVTAISERVLGHDHPDTLASRHEVAYYVGATGDPQGALELFRAVAADRIRVLGADHPDALSSRGMLAFYLSETGDPQSALDHIRAVTDDRARVLGTDHPATLWGRHEAASYTASTGDAATARELMQAVIADRARVLGSEHPDTIVSRFSLAFFTGLSGDESTAADMFRAVEASSARVLGPEHADTLGARFGIAYYTRTADPERALGLFMAVADDSERLFGSHAPSTLASRRMVASLTATTRGATAAVPLHREVAEAAERAYGPEHDIVLAIRHDLARYMADAGDITGALELARNLVAYAERAHGPHGSLAVRIRATCARLEATLTAAAGEPLPRELEEALRIASEDETGPRP